MSFYIVVPDNTPCRHCAGALSHPTWWVTEEAHRETNIGPFCSDACGNAWIAADSRTREAMRQAREMEPAP